MVDFLCAHDVAGIGVGGNINICLRGVTLCEKGEAPNFSEYVVLVACVDYIDRTALEALAKSYDMWAVNRDSGMRGFKATK